ncbi:hypothetical protein [Larkinella sp.]|uniref:hypothetical protein n=1 Tax=Larkinella sp. TaxID=2034517 RepID=UPI003BAA5C60
MKKLFFFLLIGFLACKHDVDCETMKDETTGIVTAVLSERVAYDQKIGDLGRFGLRISTAEEFQRVFDRCCAGRLETIDFSQNDVLGLSTVNRGCKSTYQLDVQRDDATKRVIYTVTERYCRRCSPSDGRGNYVVIPKVPEGYEVKFVRKN